MTSLSEIFCIIKGTFGIFQFVYKHKRTNRYEFLLYYILINFSVDNIDLIETLDLKNSNKYL